jgi:hypothetical protein
MDGVKSGYSAKTADPSSAAKGVCVKLEKAALRLREDSEVGERGRG